MNQIDRITYYEKLYTNSKEILNELYPLLERYQEIQSQIKELIHYYESDDWKFDFSCDEKHLLPTNLKRGVLSEDGIYNLLEQHKELLLLLQNLEKKDDTE